VKPTVKIGLSAPFEGLHRDLGYEVLHAVRLAVRQRNDSGGIDEYYLVELVALNDFNEAEEAMLQAREMDVDPGILGVLGGWSPGTARAAGPEYERLGLAFLAPETDLGSAQPGGPVDPAFAASYKELSGGAPPGPAAVWAYSTANRLLDAMAAAAADEGRLTRANVRAALATGRQ
jgi:ABC-type branched-subunit amino acid transport system substrate-binding protein